MKVLGFEVKEMEGMELASIHNVGPYMGDQKLFENMFNKLMDWAGPKKLMTETTKMVSVYHNDPMTLPEEEHEMSVCISVAKEVTGSGDIKRIKLQSGKYAIGRYELSDNEYEDAWTNIIREKMVEANVEMLDGECFEVYLNNPEEHESGKQILDICIPVK